MAEERKVKGMDLSLDFQETSAEETFPLENEATTSAVSVQWVL